MSGCHLSTVLIASTSPTLFFHAVPPTILSSFLFFLHAIIVSQRSLGRIAVDQKKQVTFAQKKKSLKLLVIYLTRNKAYQVFRNPFRNILIKQIKHTIDRFELIYTICTSARFLVYNYIHASEFKIDFGMSPTRKVIKMLN